MAEKFDKEVFDRTLGVFLNKINGSFKEKIKSFLNDSGGVTECMFKVSDDNIGIFEIIKKPVEVKFDGQCDDDSDYSAEKRTVTFNENGDVIFIRCKTDFDVISHTNIRFDTIAEKKVYANCGVMKSRSFRKRRYSILQVVNESLDSSGEYVDPEPIIVNLDYEKIFGLGIKTLFNEKDDYDNPNISLAVDCERKSHDVAKLHVFKKDSCIPSVYDTYFVLDGYCAVVDDHCTVVDDHWAVELPEISFPLHENHVDYKLEVNFGSKSLDECLKELNDLLIEGKIEQSQLQYLMYLATENGRDTLESSGYKYINSLLGR